MKLPDALFCSLVCCAGLMALAPAARADIWLCVAENGRQSIQDKPCAKGTQQKSHVADSPRRASAARVEGAAPRSPGKPPIEVGLQRNKAVICKLLDSERADAMAQIGGSLAPPPGEDPSSNLVKIEKQRTRVGCDAG